MQPNHLLALLGLVLIATSATGLILVEEKLPGAGMNWDLKTFHAAFPITTGAVTSTGSTADGGSDSATLTITDLNLTDATLIVSWSDNRPRLNRNSASVSVDVAGPQGQSESGDGGQGGISIDLGRFNIAPNDTDLKAASSSDAVKDIMEKNPTTTNGSGDWTITITVTRAGIAGPFRRGSVDWAVVIEYAHYSFILTEAGVEPSGTPKAIQTFETLSPGVSG